jgi:SAM-dependent methyltransferase
MKLASLAINALKHRDKALREPGDAARDRRHFEFDPDGQPADESEQPLGQMSQREDPPAVDAGAADTPPQGITSVAHPPSIDEVPHKRFLSDAKERFAQYIDAAREYPNRLSEGATKWLALKPFDPTRGNPVYTLNLFAVVGLLRRLDLRPGARILEVGCGPGWLTEILALLGHQVIAFDPSDEFVDITNYRISQAAIHYRDDRLSERVRCFQGSIEDLQIEDESIDAVIFFDVLHHVVDEVSAIANCMAWLRPGGRLAVIEGAWLPGHAESERKWEEEMAAYGTLENPFTSEYLDALLRHCGFTEIQRLVFAGGLIDSERKDEPLANFVWMNPVARNDLIARKPVGVLSSKDYDVELRVEMTVGRVDFVRDSIVVDVTVRNTGNAILLKGGDGRGATFLALRKNLPGADDFREAKRRFRLPDDLFPQEQVDLRATFAVENADHHGWTLDVVVERVAWLGAGASQAVMLAPSA